MTWIRSHRVLSACIAVAAVLALAAGAFLAVRLSEQGDVSNPSVAFTAETTPPPAPVRPRGNDFFWPYYGLDQARTKNLPLRRNLRPPFRDTWSLRGSVVLEFPPALAHRSLYLLKNDASLWAVSRLSGRKLWTRDMGALAASSPAYAKGTLYVTVLKRSNKVNAGRVAAVSASTGRVRWSRNLPSRSESSPVVDGGHVYFGSEDGTVYSLRTSDGSVQWRYKAPGAVKAGLALSGGVLFVGDYAGDVHAIRQSDGKAVWSKGTSGAALGFSSGTFYSTPAVAYGRVYLGNTDGSVYSYSAKDGSLAWRTGTGNYVYSSPAVTHIPGGPRLVFAGSYDGTVYAFDARTGQVRWKHKAEGKISGGLFVLGDLVFYSTLNQHTTALGVASGRQIWTRTRGYFNPVTSDGCRIFLNGSTSLFAMNARPHCPGDPPGQRSRIVGSPGA